MATLPPADFWSAAEKARYVTGYSFGRNADVSAYSADDFFMAGHTDELYGNPPLVSIQNKVLDVGPVEFWTTDQKFAYTNGFMRYPSPMDLPFNDSERFYYVKGYDDAVAGRPALILQPTGPVTPYPNTGIVPPNRRGPIRVAPPVYQPAPQETAVRGPFLEAYAYIDLPFVGRGLAFDTAVKLDTLESKGTLVPLVQEVVKFALLGREPGDERRGFKLSGPTGPTAAAVRQWVMQGNPADPRALGLPFWVAARTRRGARLLSARAIKNIIFETGE